MSFLCILVDSILFSGIGKLPVNPVLLVSKKCLQTFLLKKFVYGDRTLI